MLFIDLFELREQIFELRFRVRAVRDGDEVLELLLARLQLLIDLVPDFHESLRNRVVTRAAGRVGLHLQTEAQSPFQQLRLFELMHRDLRQRLHERDILFGDLLDLAADPVHNEDTDQRGDDAKRHQPRTGKTDLATDRQIPKRHIIVLRKERR